MATSGGSRPRPGSCASAPRAPRAAPPRSARASRSCIGQLLTSARRIGPLRLGHLGGEDLLASMRPPPARRAGAGRRSRSGSATSMPSGARAGRGPGQQPVAAARRRGTPRRARGRSSGRPARSGSRARSSPRPAAAAGRSKATPSSWSSAAWATHAAISPASAVDSSARTGRRRSAPRRCRSSGAGRTLHHSWVCSTIEFVRTRKST